MPKFALNQPGGLGYDIDPDSMIPTSGWGGKGAATGTPSILDTVVSTGTGILSTISQPDVVKAALNKYIFGKPGGIPVTANIPGGVRPASDNRTILYIGIGLAALLILSRRK